MLQTNVHGRTHFERLASSYKENTHPITYGVLCAGKTTKEITLQLLEIENKTNGSAFSPDNTEKVVQLKKQYQAACETIAKNLP